VIKLSIVMTGIGIVSTAGHTIESFWNTLSSGKNTYSVIDEYNNSQYRYHVGAKISDDSWEFRLPVNKHIENYGNAAKYAISASVAALQDAHISEKQREDLRIAVCIGTTMGEIEIEEDAAKQRSEGGHLSQLKEQLSHYPTDKIGQAVRTALNLRSSSYILEAACSGGNYAIALARLLLESGQADIVLAGGVDVFSRIAFAGFQRLLSLDPQCCRPFDRDRKGMILGEGCGIVIMERKEQAEKRGSKYYGELIGCGLASDRYHMITPHPQGDGALRAMNLAIRDSGISKKQIQYVSAHGTGTIKNDEVETEALISFFGEKNVPPVSSIKSILGHSMGAASALECIASLLILQKGEILPTANLKNQDPALPLDYVANKPRKQEVEYALSNSFAFGGQCGCLLLKRGNN
jgi:3-oxoacyl-[acyl-carrier-protein] synthase II